MRCRTDNRRIASCDVGDGAMARPYHSTIAIKDISATRDAAPAAAHSVADHRQPLGRAAVHSSGRRVDPRDRHAAPRRARRRSSSPAAPDFLDGSGPPLARPMLDIDGVRHELSEVPIAWERALGWIPTFTCTVGDLVRARNDLRAVRARRRRLGRRVRAVDREPRRRGRRRSTSRSRERSGTGSFACARRGRSRTRIA